MTNEQIWDATLGDLEIALSHANFTTWFKNTRLISYNNNVFIIGVPNPFTKTWFEKKYNQIIIKALQSVTQIRIKEVVYTVELEHNAGINNFFKSKIGAGAKKLDGQVDKQFIAQEVVREQSDGSYINSLNKKYRFDNFIVGKGNELAHAAAIAIVNNPGRVYNPLFIYGGVGLGKTHLMQAVGNALLAKTSNARILYTTSERFTNDFIQAVRNNKAKGFNDTYRNCDMLMIDDIEFIAGKEGTQEAFFHTFNSLYQKNKQIIITSDRPPQSMSTLEDRLLSRFECGMVADISTPDLETRMAILETKCAERGTNLNVGAIEYLAKKFYNNVRELEGALNRVITYNQINDTNIDAEAIADMFAATNNSQKTKRTISSKKIIEAVVKYYNLEMSNIIGDSRKKEFALPRQIAMYLMREDVDISYPTIGREVGNRDHTTAIHAYNKINKEIGHNERIKADIKLIRDMLYND